MKDSALTEIREDFEELEYLCLGYKKTLLQFQKSLSRLQGHPTTPVLTEQIKQLTKHFESLEKEILQVITKLKKASEKNLEEFSSEKRRLFIELRSIIPMVGSLITSTDWQSPSFMYSLYSEAGIQEGKIVAHINDYKRDQHLNERAYQEQFLKEYVDGLKIPASAYLTSSGMAALTTIITFLLSRKMNGPIMMGTSMYFENTGLLETFFKDHKIIKVDDMNTSGILKLFDHHQPDVIFLDSLCNAPSVAIPDTPSILKHVTRHAKKDTYFIIDNSTLSIALQPLKILRLPSKVKLIVFESLNKYHQFGLDRVTAGIIWFRGSGMEELYDARDHAGTNISDTAVYALPTPDRKRLTMRLSRHQRNTQYLSQSLETYISKKSLRKIDGIVYPGLQSHPSYAWSKNYSFQGSYFVITFKKPYQKVKIYQRFVEAILENARKKKVSINGGTSFGFNTTRIYLTAHNSDYGAPFIRVSLGTETIRELERIKDVFTNTLQSF